MGGKTMQTQEGPGVPNVPGVDWRSGEGCGYAVEDRYDALCEADWADGWHATSGKGGWKKRRWTRDHEVERSWVELQETLPATVTLAGAGRCFRRRLPRQRR